MNVADLIASRSDVYSISDEATVHDAARYLRERQGCAPPAWWTALESLWG